MKKVFGLLILSLLLGLESQAVTPIQSAKIQGVILQAQSMSGDLNNDTTELDDNVQIIYQDKHIRCGKAFINWRSKTIEASQNVLFISQNATIGGDKIIVNFEDNSGVIINGYVQSGNVLFEGAVITKYNETEYLADDARFTTCTTCPEAWSFSGKDIRAELGSYAYLKNSVMRFGGWPLIWFPYLIVPLKSDRQSGLLTPELEQSQKGGLTISDSYYWASSKSDDSTIAFKNYELRGLKGLYNYRYAINDTSGGELNTAYLSDRVLGSDTTTNSFRSQGTQGVDIQRWYVKYDSFYEMPNNWFYRANINHVSDLQYPNDFPLETLNHGDSAGEDRMSVTKNTFNQHFSIDTSYYQNLLQSDPLASNQAAVHRLPEIKFDQTKTEIGHSGLIYSLDGDYTNFARSGQAYDQMNTDYITGGLPNNIPANAVTDRHVQATSPNGVTNSACSGINWETIPGCTALRSGNFNQNTDLIRSGQRLDLQPTLYRPFKFGDFDVLPSLGVRDTEYYFDVNNFQSDSRRYVKAEVAARTTFSSIFNANDPNPKDDRYKHEIIPQVTATDIPWIYHPPHPFFGTNAEAPFFSQETLSDADLNSPYGIQFDYNDRVYDHKLLTFELTNKLTQKRLLNDKPDYRQILTWRVAQSYDAYQVESGLSTQPLSDLTSELKINLDHLQIYQKSDYYPYANKTISSSSVRFNNDVGDFMQVAYISTYAVTPVTNGLQLSTRTDSYILSLRKTYKFIDFLGKMAYVPSPPKDQDYLNSWGYGAQFRLPGDCFYLDLINYRVTGGDPTYKVNFSFVWNGKDRPRLDNNLLDSFGF